MTRQEARGTDPEKALQDWLRTQIAALAGTETQTIPEPETIWNAWRALIAGRAIESMETDEMARTMQELINACACGDAQDRIRAGALALWRTMSRLNGSDRTGDPQWERLCAWATLWETELGARRETW